MFPSTDRVSSPRKWAARPEMRTDWATSDDVDALWHFYFATGFLYADKLRALPDCGELVKENLRSLLDMNSSDYRVALTRDVHGAITSACASANFSDSQNWVMHLASNGNWRAMHASMERAGQSAVESAPWMACTFRPNNRGVARLFSSYAEPGRQHIEDRIYDYFVFSAAASPAARTGNSAGRALRTREAHPLDYENLLDRCDPDCGAVAALRATGMLPAQESIARIERRMRAHGLRRHRHAVAVTASGRTQAIGVMDLTPYGWNFSNLGTGLQMFGAPEATEETYSELLRVAADWFQQHAPFGLWTALVPADRPQAASAIAKLGLTRSKHYARIGVPSSLGAKFLAGYGRRLARVGPSESRCIDSEDARRESRHSTGWSSAS